MESLQDAEEDLSFLQEGLDTRARAVKLNFLFPRSDRDAIAQMFEVWSARARARFGPRWSSFTGPNIIADDYQAMIREITLTWMQFFVLNGMPVQIAEAEWRHPRTYQIIESTVERALAPRSQQATVLCAQLMGISRDQYVEWSDGNKWRLSIQ